MIDVSGVEILAMEEVVVDSVFNWTALLIVFGIILAMYILIGFAISKKTDDWKNLKIGIIVGSILGVFFGAAMGFAFEIPVEFDNEYKVIISDEVSMNDFFEKYEIIDTEGKIYTVVERD